jgi:hypothetical protein
MVVLPEHDTVVAFFSHTEPMQAFMDEMWEHLLPALDAGVEPDPDGDRLLAERTTDLRVPTAVDRRGRSAAIARAATGRFARADDGSSHSSITELEVADGQLVVHEGEAIIRVPLTSSWTDLADHPISASAAVDDDGAVSVQLVMRASPHRLELRTDPSTRTFRATWPLFPLFGLGLDGVLHRMHPPEG